MNLGERCEACGLCASEIDDYEGEAIDPCLGVLPGVAFACCGHGEGSGYVAFGEPGGVHRVIRFDRVTRAEQWPASAGRPREHARSPVVQPASWVLDIPARPEPEPPTPTGASDWAPFCWTPDELAEARAEMGLAAFEAEYMSRPTCGHEVLVGVHSTACILTSGHEGDCDPGENWLRRHDCKRNGCGRRGEVDCGSEPR